MSPPAIELDVSGPWEPPERPPASGRARRVLAAVVICALLLGAAVSDRRGPSLGPAYRIAGEGVVNFQLHGDGVYLIRQDGNSTLAEAYRLRDGHRLWSVPQDRSDGYFVLAGDRMIVSRPRAGSTDLSVLVGLDTADGHEVWQRPSATLTTTGNGEAAVLLAQQAEPGSAVFGDTAHDRTVFGVDTRTGATRWRRVIPAGTYGGTIDTDPWRIGAGQTNLVEVTPDGTLTVRSVTDGTVLRTVRLDSPGPVDGVSLAGDRALVDGTSAGEGTARDTALYDLTTGHRIWYRPGNPDGRPNFGGDSVDWCGATLFCAFDNGNVTAFEATAGRQLWRILGGYVYVAPTEGPWVLAITTLRTDDGDDVNDGTVLDARTGRTAVHLPGWQIVDWAAWPRLTAVRQTVPGQGVVADVDGVTGRVDVFGRADRLYGPANCLAATGFLLCRTGALTAWRRPA